MISQKELLQLISRGEGNTVEFKQSTTNIAKDVYESICAFSNRDGGHIFMGVKDNGQILGIQPNCIEKIKKDFVTVINNSNKMYPPLFLTPIEQNIDGKRILYIYVPVSSQVSRCSGRIFDRNNESDIDITDNADLVFKLYAKKQGTYFVNKVFPEWGIDVLRSDLIERARKMTYARTDSHPWLSMNDEELLRSAGLILLDIDKRIEGITLAAILLFGKDTAIMSALPHHKTDAIFRIQNLDRYDDRDVIITNLLESYDRMSAFAKKHLNDPFVLDGMQSVSARDAILREIISNSLAHRDYSSGYVAKFIIEKERIFTENSNRSHGFGNLNLSTFQPYPKNPAISKVFREIGLADELGSGMRNTYKYTKLYTGGVPEFLEGDLFTTIIPLNADVTMKSGPNSSDQNTGIENQNTGTENQNTGIENQNTGTENQNTGTENQNTGTENQNTGTENQNTGIENQNTGIENKFNKKNSARQKILCEIRKDSFTTLNQLVERTGLSRNGVRYIMERLKTDGILERTGSTKKGQWIIKSMRDT